MYFAVVGNHPHISEAEWESLGATDIVRKGSLILFEYSGVLPSTIGGSLKRGRQIDVADLKELFEEKNLVAVADDHDGMQFKRTYGLKRFKYVPINKTDKEIVTKGRELIRLDEHQELWGVVEHYHDIAWSEKIEFEKPMSGMNIGMMPVKLVQMLVNMGVGKRMQSAECRIQKKEGIGGVEGRVEKVSQPRRKRRGEKPKAKSHKGTGEYKDDRHSERSVGSHEVATGSDSMSYGAQSKYGAIAQQGISSLGDHNSTGSLGQDDSFSSPDSGLLVPDSPLTIYDPFCGFGTTGFVAHLNGHHFIGSDTNPTPAKQNLPWWKGLYEQAKDLHFTLFKHDVKQPFTQPFLKHADAVVTEGWLGPVVNNQLTFTRKENEWRDIITEIDEVYIGFIKNFHAINPDAVIVITYPQRTFWKEDMSLGFQRAAKALGYTVESIGVYKRKKQFVGRRVIRLAVSKDA